MRNRNIISEQRMNRIIRESILDTLKDKAKSVKGKIRDRLEKYGQKKGYLPRKYEGSWARSWESKDDK